MLGAFRNITRIPELKRKLLITAALLAVCRIGVFIPIPGVDTVELGRRLAKVGKVTYNGFLLQFEVGDHQMVVFPDGRALVKGTTDEALARTLYAKYLGS